MFLIHPAILLNAILKLNWFHKQTGQLTPKENNEEDKLKGTLFSFLLEPASLDAAVSTFYIKTFLYQQNKIGMALKAFPGGKEVFTSLPLPRVYSNTAMNRSSPWGRSHVANVTTSFSYVTKPAVTKTDFSAWIWSTDCLPRSSFFKRFLCALCWIRSGESGSTSTASNAPTRRFRMQKYPNSPVQKISLENMETGSCDRQAVSGEQCTSHTAAADGTSHYAHLHMFTTQLQPYSIKKPGKKIKNKTSKLVLQKVNK